MHYTDEALMQIKNESFKLRFKYYDLVMQLSTFAAKVKNQRAREYLVNGVMRRLFVLYRCIENILKLFPADRTEKLTYESRIDLEINLHSFLINIYGILENLGLAMAIENGLISGSAEEKQKRTKIGLFTKVLKEKMNPPLREYLENSTISSWYHQYARNYRDALAHRIPPYVPPAGLNAEQRKEYDELDQELYELSRHGYSEKYSKTIEKQSSLGIASPFFVHSFSEKAKPVYLHQQVISDFWTVEDLIGKILADFYFSS